MNQRNEIQILEKEYSPPPQELDSYLAGNSMTQFRADLLDEDLDLQTFETKYTGCFNGMMENIIGYLIEREKLYQYLDKPL